MLVNTLSTQVIAIAMVMNGFFFLFGFLVAMLVGLRVVTDVVDEGRPVEVLVVDEEVVPLVVGVDGVELPVVVGVVGVVLPVVDGVDWVVEVVVELVVVVGGSCPQFEALSAAIGIPPTHSMFCTCKE